MAEVAAMLTTFNAPNFVGELFFLTPAENPFTAMIGGLTGGKRVSTIDLQWQVADNWAATQPSITQGADATFTHRDRSARSNVVQIHQEGIHVAYTKQAATGNLSGLAILGNQPVQDEKAFQVTLKLQKVQRDVEYSFLQGVYQKPVDNTTGRQTRGMKNAITTNAVAGGAAQLTTTMVNTLLRNMWTAGAPFLNVVIFCNAYQKQKFSELYGYAPQSRNVGGVNINVIETDFGLFGIVLDRHMPNDEVYFIDLAVCAPSILEIPELGFLFMEDLAKTGSAWKKQLYGEIGLEYGPEEWHGKITGLATS